MKLYWRDRIVIGLLLLVFYSTASFFAPSAQSGWIFILLATHVISFAHFFVGPIGSWLDVVILNSYVTLTLGVVHVTTSLMSENWFQKGVMRLKG